MDGRLATTGNKCSKKWIVIAVPAITAIAYFIANPNPGSYYDYTLRIARALLSGRTGLEQHPGSWLNEFVPLNGKFYSVFPLGAVLTLSPLAAFGVETLPSAALSALIGALAALFALGISKQYLGDLKHSSIFSLWLTLGTWSLCTLGFGGAWQLALGFALVGQLGAIYFSLVSPAPLICGIFFSLGFGNRTELLITAPWFFWIFMRNRNGGEKRALSWKPWLLFSVFPFVLGCLTLLYNYLRFDSIADFGYARIPGVLEEPWYRDGIFSFSAISLNFREMLLTTWKSVNGFPYYTPTGFGGSILLSSPFLVLLLRTGFRDRAVKYTSWLIVAVLTLILWCHGNPGGWQYSYRYAMDLLPWMLLIVLETEYGRKPSALLALLLLVSVTINIWATYLFHWTEYVRP